jgi:hypothetical protein
MGAIVHDSAYQTVVIAGCAVDGAVLPASLLVHCYGRTVVIDIGELFVYIFGDCDNSTRETAWRCGKRGAQAM